MKYKFFGQLHILSWFLKDMFWCLKIDSAALFMIIPTVILSIIAVLYDREENTLTNVTILTWVSVNAFWMSHELIGTPIGFAYFPLVLGSVMCLWIMKSIVYELGCSKVSANISQNIKKFLEHFTL